MREAEGQYAQPPELDTVTEEKEPDTARSAIQQQVRPYTFLKPAHTARFCLRFPMIIYDRLSYPRYSRIMRALLIRHTVIFGNHSLSLTC